MVLLKSIRLALANKSWQSAIKRIRNTSDYGMCCSERAAIECAKEYYFGKLLPYADKYTPD